MGFKLKGGAAVITITATALTAFIIGWYAKKLHDKVKDAVSDKKSDDGDD